MLSSKAIKNFGVLGRILKFRQCSTSAPEKRTREDFAFVSPYLDFDRRFSDLNKLQKELAFRGIQTDIKQLAKTWEYYKHVHLNKMAIQKKKEDMEYEMKTLIKNKNKTSEEEQKIKMLQSQMKVLRQDYQMLRQADSELEENVVIKALRLPNDLDQSTPDKEPVVVKTVGCIKELPQDKRESHLDIGKKLGLIDYRHPLHCFFSNEAVIFEFGALNLASKILADSDYIHMSGVDFSRSLVIDGCGMDYKNPMESFILQNNPASNDEYSTDNKLHLTGGASLPSFLAMFTKQIINPKNFPVKFFATGRQYTPFSGTLDQMGLFTLCQASAAGAFTLVKDQNSNEYRDEFQNLLDVAYKIYNSIGCHYRVVTRSAAELKPWESSRVSIEMWSTFSNQYIEVGYVAGCGDFFSKRLLIVYENKTVSRGFPSAVTGTLISVPRVLACLLEENPEEFVVPENVAEMSF